ncbi:MAG: hypothetical protein IPL35_14895 [Sphingobacteriales bacterium]|nr:hypothetical protein [Sphingobacteriales bacterium]
MRLYGLDGIATLLRGTIRYRGYCDAWNAIVQLGLADNTFKTDTAALTYGAFTASFVPEQYSSIYPLKKQWRSCWQLPRQRSNATIRVVGFVFGGTYLCNKPLRPPKLCATFCSANGNCNPTTAIW